MQLKLKIMIELKGKYTDAKIFIDINDIEDGLIESVQELIDTKTSEGLKVRLMCDAHKGKGANIGSTMELGYYLKPGMVGCDIGCGMTSGKFNTLNIELDKLDHSIRRGVPMGFNINKNNNFGEIPFADIQLIADVFIEKYNNKFGTDYKAPIYNQEWLDSMLKRVKLKPQSFYNSIGTLGQGNHFIELGISESQEYFVTVHTGSRNLGAKVETYWTSVAETPKIKPSDEYKTLVDELVKNTTDKSELPKIIKDFNISYAKNIVIDDTTGYLSDYDLVNYLFDMIFTQQYAVWNRTTILESIRKSLRIDVYDEIINTTHNYINFKDFIIRKGAIASYEDEKVIIPFNMRDGMIVCAGKSNPEWNFSAPHGSGRKFSRTAAIEKFNIEEFKKTMDGIYSTSVCIDTIDESPMSYKDTDTIKRSIEPTVNILHTVKPILNIKDNSKKESWKDRKNKKKGGVK